MKIVFLDFNGVLNDTSPKMDNLIDKLKHYHLLWILRLIRYDPLSIKAKYVKRLHKICRKTKAYVVVTDECRGPWITMDPQYIEGKYQKRIVKLLRRYHIDILEKTQYSSNKTRGEEIQTYIDRYKAYPNMIESFVILDDEVFDLYEKFPNDFIHTSKLVKPDDPYETTGLSKENVKRAIQILKKKKGRVVNGKR